MKARLAVALSALILVSTAAQQLGARPAKAAKPDGKALYDSRCSTCHQPGGEGIAGSFPPLAKNKDVTAANPRRIIGIVLHGLNAPLKVNGKTYSGGMPSWKGQLTNAEIAAVLTYVRSSWGNKASAVTEKAVAAVR